MPEKEFDLETELAEWRQQLGANRNVDARGLDELEDHLREAFAAYCNAGMGERAAWNAAVAKFGDSQSVGREFDKIDRLSSVDRAAFGAVIAAALIGLGLTAWIAIEPRGAMASSPLLATHVVTITIAYVAGLAAAAIAGYAGIKVFFLPDSSPRLIAAASRWVGVSSVIAAPLAVAGFTLGAFWAKANWGVAVDLSDFREGGALLAALCFAGAGIASRSRAGSPRVPAALAVIGGGLILSSWLCSPGRAIAPRPTFPLFGYSALALSILVAAMAFRKPTVSDRRNT